MTWGYVAVGAGTAIAGYMGNKSAKESAKASERAAGMAAEGQSEALSYLQEVEALPSAYREAGLKGLGQEVGLTLDEEGNVISDGSTTMQRAQQDPLYTSMMSNIEAQNLGRGQAEESLARSASMTGLRGGNIQGMLYDYNTRLNQQQTQQQNQALLGSYNRQMQGMQGLAGLQSYAPQIANLQTGIGATQAAGIQAAGQARQAGLQNVGNVISTGIGQYAQYRQNNYGGTFGREATTQEALADAPW